MALPYVRTIAPMPDYRLFRQELGLEDKETQPFPQLFFLLSSDPRVLFEQWTLFTDQID